MIDEREMNQTATVELSRRPAQRLRRGHLGVLLALLMIANVISFGLLPSAGYMGFVGATFLGLTFGQVSVLSAWAVFGRRYIGWRSLAPFAAGLVYAVLMIAGDPDSPFRWRQLVTYLALLWFHAAFSISVLWMIKTAGWVRPIGFNDKDRAGQFTIANLLAVTTASAIMLALFVRNTELNRAIVEVATFVIANVLLLVVAIFFVSRTSWHRLARAASILALAFAVGLFCEATDLALANELNFTVYSLVQATVLWLCLELGPILPDRPRSMIASDEPPTTEAGPARA